jgi:hypothetical protein
VYQIKKRRAVGVTRRSLADEGVIGLSREFSNLRSHGRGGKCQIFCVNDLCWIELVFVVSALEQAKKRGVFLLVPEARLFGCLFILDWLMAYSTGSRSS